VDGCPAFLLTEGVRPCAASCFPFTVTILHGWDGSCCLRLTTRYAAVNTPFSSVTAMVTVLILPWIPTCKPGRCSYMVGWTVMFGSRLYLRGNLTSYNLAVNTAPRARGFCGAASLPALLPWFCCVKELFSSYATVSYADLAASSLLPRLEIHPALHSTHLLIHLILPTTCHSALLQSILPTPLQPVRACRQCSHSPVHCCCLQLHTHTCPPRPFSQSLGR